MEEEFLRDLVYLCVPENLFQQYYTPQEIKRIKSRSSQGANIRDFARLPFSLMTNRLGERMRICFTREGVQPNVLLTAPSSAQTLPLCSRGVAACYCTHMGLLEAQGQISPQVNIFPILEQGEPLVQNLSLLRHRQRYLTHFSKYFMELLFQTTARMEQVELVHTV